MDKKTKGSIAELRVSSDLMEKGWNVLIPFGENNRYDLVVERDGRFVRIQVKYVTPKNGAMEVNCRSSNNWSVRPYTCDEIDFIAAYNPEDQAVYYVPISKIRKKSMKLRLEPSRNGQKLYVRYAKEFAELI